ncbi:MAG: hypothetical protein J5967_08140 [Oscillospiraceae bacterium]|nr:hypothetical protein [Oscillospiraceae bacterium]
MKQTRSFVLAALLLAALVLTGCGKRPGMGVSTNEDNSIAVTADRAPKGSAGLGYLTVGENETVVVEPDFEKEGTIRLRMMAGLLGAEDFPEEPTVELTVSGRDDTAFSVPAGEYTVGILADSKLTGTARLWVRPDESTESENELGYTPDDLLGQWAEKIAGRGVIEIGRGETEGTYDVLINWGSSASERYVWTMTAVPEEANVLRYEDGSLRILTLREDGAESEELQYENGSGRFVLLSTYEIQWEDETGHAGDDCVFVNAG